MGRIRRKQTARLVKKKKKEEEEEEEEEERGVSRKNKPQSKQKSKAAPTKVHIIMHTRRTRSRERRGREGSCRNVMAIHNETTSKLGCPEWPNLVRHTLM